MIFRQLTTDGDWTYGKGRSGFARDQAAINLNILTTLKSWKGNCFFATQFGIDWKNLLNMGQQAALDSAIQTALLQSYGVMSVTRLSNSYNPLTRFLNISYTVDTVYSQNVTGTLRTIMGAI